VAASDSINAVMQLTRKAPRSKRLRNAFRVFGALDATGSFLAMRDGDAQPPEPDFSSSSDQVNGAATAGAAVPVHELGAGH
jgi:hypothetical protein